MTREQIVLFAVQASIFLTVFGFGLHATREDLLYVIRRPRTLLRSLVAMFVIMPLFALLISQAFALHRPVEIALGALAISPVPPLLPRREVKAGGQGSYGLGLLVTASVLSIGIIPLVLQVTGSILGRPVSLSPVEVARIAMISVLLPLAIGMGFRALAPAFAARISRPVGFVANALLALGGLVLLLGVWSVALSLIGNGTLLILVAFVAVGLGVGHLLGGPAPQERADLALCTACRHPALALAVSHATFPEEPSVVGAIVLYLLLSLLVSIPYASRMRQKVGAR
jgi:BASS family bile acid:Na+ symporter